VVVIGFVWVGNSFCVSGHPYVGRDVVAGMRLALNIGQVPTLSS
jgi:hypothetical protein